MPERVSTMVVRQRIGDMLNRVSLRNDEFIIERKGKALAALVPVDRLDQMREFARRQLRALMREQRGTGGKLSDKEAMDLALEAQRWARRHARRPRASRK